MGVMEVIGYISLCLGVVAMIYKGVKELKRPVDEVNVKLNNDYDKINQIYDRLRKLEDDMKFTKQSNKIIVDGLLQLFRHLETDNNTGEMTRTKKDMIDFLNSKAFD